MTLGFIEPFAETEQGARVFCVTANGETILDEFDIRRETEGTGAAITRTFTVDVTGGLLRLRFTPIVGDAVVSTIMVSEA